MCQKYFLYFLTKGWVLGHPKKEMWTIIWGWTFCLTDSFILLKWEFHVELLTCSLVPHFQRLIYPPENEGDASITKSIQKNIIHGTIWSMCFISQDSSQPSKEHNPVLAILLNRYGNWVCVHRGIKSYLSLFAAVGWIFFFFFSINVLLR